MQWALSGIYVLLMPAIPISIRYLAFLLGDDTLTINGVRLLMGGLVLLVYVLFRHRAALSTTLRDRRQVTGIALLAACNLLCLYTNTEGLVRTSAVTTQFIGTLALPLAIALAVIFFPNERAITRKPSFWIGLILSLTGTIGISLASGSISLRSKIGVLYLLAFVVIWVGANMLVRRLVEFIPVIIMTTLSTLMIALAFLLWSVFQGKPAALFHASPLVISLLIASGIYGVIVGTGMAFLITKRLGVIVFQFIGLLIPFLTGVLEYLLLKETLTFSQAMFGMLIVLGCAIMLRFARYEPGVEIKESRVRGVEYEGV